MNPRQRRGLILLFIASLGALAVFVSVLSFVSDVNARAGNYVQIVSLSHDVKAYQPISVSDVELKEVPEKWVSPSTVRDARDVVGLVPVNDFRAGTHAERGMFIDRPGIAKGHREIAIMVDSETGVAGKVKPGDRVDIIATFEGKDTAKPVSRLWAQNALIINVGVPSDVPKTDQQGGFQSSTGVPVTFALPTEEALRVAYAESFSTKVRLALRAPNDDQSVPDADRTYELSDDVSKPSPSPSSSASPSPGASPSSAPSPSAKPKRK